MAIPAFDQADDRALGDSPTLGVVAIAWNEERDLPGFLANLIGWVDEIVIVDDGSTDRTPEIAKAAGEKISFIASPRGSGEYFADQRNKGIRAASSAWLLHMDVDERVPPELATEIRNAIRDNSKDGYRFRRLNYFLHRPMRGGGWQDWNMIHLARRDLFHFEGMFHERCVLSAPVSRIGQLKERMWHLNDISYNARMRKSLVYSEEQAKRLSERYRRIRWFHFLMLPALEFLRKYIYRKGYRDGTLGLLFAVHSADAMFRATALVWDQQNPAARADIEVEVSQSWKGYNPKNSG